MAQKQTKKHYLFILENYIPHIGGVEILFKNITEGLVEKGHEVSIVTHRLKGTKKYEIIGGVKVYRINCFGSRYWFTFLSIPKSIQLAKKADIICTTTFNGAFPAWIASKVTKNRCILTVSEVWINKWGKLNGMDWISAKIHSLLERGGVYGFHFDKYVCISKATKKDLMNLIHIDEKKIEIIYPGIDYKFFNPKKYNGVEIRKKFNLKKEFVYIFYGRPGISKGLKYLIKAVPQISEKIPNSKLLAIVSKDPSYKKGYEEMEELIKELKIRDKIILINPVERKELPKYIKAANCIVVPSLAEGFGFSAAEACAMNVPVVVTNEGSLPEVVSGKYITIKSKSPEEIVRGVETVYKDNIKKTQKKIFKWEDTIKKYEDLSI